MQHRIVMIIISHPFVQVPPYFYYVLGLLVMNSIRRTSSSTRRKLSYFCCCSTTITRIITAHLMSPLNVYLVSTNSLGITQHALLQELRASCSYWSKQLRQQLQLQIGNESIVGGFVMYRILYGNYLEQYYIQVQDSIVMKNVIRRRKT